MGEYNRPGPFTTTGFSVEVPIVKVLRKAGMGTAFRQGNTWTLAGMTVSGLLCRVITG